MSDKHFTCDPVKLCDGCMCCKSPETRPSLSAGDYLRLSQHTGEPIASIWRSKGDVSLTSHKGMPRGQYLATLGLLHDPCPYLTNLRCAVHRIRPLGCASFPGMLFKNHPDDLLTIYKEYKCLKDIKPGPDQDVLVQQLDDLLRTEAELDIKYIWKMPAYIDLSSVGEYFSLAERALDQQETRDPADHNPRAQRLIKAVTAMSRLVESGEIRNGIDANHYVALSSPIVYSLLEDQIAERLENLNDDAKAAYESTSRHWREIAQRID